MQAYNSFSVLARIGSATALQVNSESVACIGDCARFVLGSVWVLTCAWCWCWCWQSMKQRLQQSALVTAAEIRKEKQPLLPSYSDVEKKELEEEGFKVCVRVCVCVGSLRVSQSSSAV